MISTLIYILAFLIFAYVAFSVGYLLLFSVAGRLFFRKKRSVFPPRNSIAVLVPSYKEDGIILSTAQHLLQQQYPRELFDVYIIADSFQPSTIAQLRQLDVEVLEVQFDKSTKAKSLNEAFARIQKPYDIALICDADNILGKNFLDQINGAFCAGARAVQGRRVAKNLDTSFAILDACSEGINNHIFRRGANALGLSSAVIGSGMAFGYQHLKTMMRQVNAVGGFDKILQLQVVEDGHRIQYLEDALVFDEKVSTSKAFEQQRKRWVSAQFIYLKKYFVPALQKAFRGNISYLNLAIGNNLVLPRAFLLLLLPLLVVAGYFLGKAWLIAGIALLVLCLVALLVALPAELVNRQLLQAVLRLPKAVLLMLKSVFTIRQANKTFIHTVHTKTEVSNTLFKDHVN